MDEHPNAKMVRDAQEKLKAGEFSDMIAMVADDVEWYEIGRPDPIHGKAALAERFGLGGGGGTPPDFEISADLHDVVANDDHTIALISAHATRGGRTLDYRTAEIYHIRDGKITARWAFSDDTARINDFFGGA